MGSPRVWRHIFFSLYFSKLNFKIHSCFSSVLIPMRWFLSSFLTEQVAVSWWEVTVRVAGVPVTGCIVPLYSYNVRFIRSCLWILFNLYCFPGQAVNSPLKRHSPGRTYGISVCQPDLPLFHPVQDVTSKRHFSPTELLLARFICGCVIDSWIWKIGTGEQAAPLTPSISNTKASPIPKHIPCFFMLTETYNSE